MSAAAGDDKRRYDRVEAHFSVGFRELDEAEAEVLADAKSLAPPGQPEDAAAPAAAPREAKTENLSEGGLSFTGDLQLLGERRLEKGKKLLVEFRLPGEPQPVSAVAVVAWNIEGKGPHGKFTAGLMFTGIEDKDLQKIQRYLEARQP